MRGSNLRGFPFSVETDSMVLAKVMRTVHLVEMGLVEDQEADTEAFSSTLMVCRSIVVTSLFSSE